MGINVSQVDFDFNYVNIKLNSLNIGDSKNGNIGIHSSKLKNGTNKLIATYYDVNGKFIKELNTTIFKRPSIRGKESIEEEYTMFAGELAKLKLKIDEIEKWKKEIENERSGF